MKIFKANKHFFYITDKTSEIGDTITTRGTFKNQVANWEKLMKIVFLKALPKIRHRKGNFLEIKLGFLITKITTKLKLHPETEEEFRETNETEEKSVDKNKYQYGGERDHGRNHWGGR